MNFLLAAHYMLCKHFNTEVICWETNIFQEQLSQCPPKIAKTRPKMKGARVYPLCFSLYLGFFMTRSYFQNDCFNVYFQVK